MLEIDRENVVSILKFFTYVNIVILPKKNRINVKIDQFEGIIEVLGGSFNENDLISQLKTEYFKLNQIQKELVVLNFEKAENLQKEKFDMRKIFETNKGF